MSLQQIVTRISKLCGAGDVAFRPFSLKPLGFKSSHRSAASYFAAAVPAKTLNGPYYRLHSGSDIRGEAAGYPGKYLLRLGFAVIASEPNGDSVAVDIASGKVYAVKHEGDPDELSRETIVEAAHDRWSSIKSFLESWRGQLTAKQRAENRFQRAAKADPCATDGFGNMMIIHHIRSGNFELVQSEVERGANLELRNHSDRTVLEEAIVFGRPDIAQYLIEQGANVNARNKYRQTPLMLAASRGQLQCIKLLVKAGAKINAKSVHGVTALGMFGVTRASAVRRLLTPS